MGLNPERPVYLSRVYDQYQIPDTDFNAQNIIQNMKTAIRFSYIYVVAFILLSGLD